MSYAGEEANALSWRKSSHSTGNGECVEVALMRGEVAIRDSKDPAMGLLLCGRRSWQVFVAATQSGVYDIRHRGA